jgi:hypothetical protein
MSDTIVIPFPEEQPVLPLWPVPAEAFDVSRPKAYALAQRGEFPCPVFRVGVNWMVRTVDLREALGLALSRPAAS